MGCFIGFFGSRSSKKGVTATDDPKETEQVEIPGGDAAAGYLRATALEPRRGGTKSSEVTALGFDLEDVYGASAELIGEGVFRRTYKVNLEIGTTLVVNRLRDFSETAFRRMVSAIDELNHENLLPLIAYHCSEDEMLLVYDYMPMGSLYELLHVNRSPLDWDTRIRIALGVARAISYIHSHRPSAFHGIIKSSNVLLTATFEARVSDYGFAQYGPTCTEWLKPPANLFSGYRDPEVFHATKVSQKADVYSFGVLFLELLTGKDPTESYLQDERMDLPRWMLSAVNEEWTSGVFDVELLRHVDVQLLLQYLELAFSCTALYPDIRPSMPEVITQIEMLCLSNSNVHETHIDIESHESFNVTEIVN